MQIISGIYPSDAKYASKIILYFKEEIDMKLNKKFLSCLTAVSLAMAPMSAFAAVTPNDTYDITGTGSVEYLNTEIYNVVLPTNESINFKVDPYGVTLPDFDESSDLGTIISNAAGTVTSSATAVINKSSVGIDVKIDLLFDQTSTTCSNSAVSLAATKTEAENGTKDLYLTVQHLSGAVLGSVATGSSVSLTGSAVSTGAFTLSNQALQINNWSSIDSTVTPVAVTATNAAAVASSEAIDFTLGDVAEAYFVTNKAASLSDAVVTFTPKNVYAFAITGYANPKASVWKDIDAAGGKLNLTLKFTIDKAEGVATAYHVQTDRSNSAYIGITEDGGITDISKLTNVKLNGVAMTTGLHTAVVSNCFAVLTGSWRVGDEITFTYDGNDYKVTLEQK